VESSHSTTAWQWLILGLLCLAIFLMRWHTYDEPFERDLNIYAVIGHEMLEGRELYADLYDQKPPAPYLTYAAAELLVGYGPQQMFALGVGAAIATLAGLYWTVLRVTRDRRLGLWAAAFWTLLCSDMLLQANQPNTEVFINAAMIWAFGLWATAGRPGVDVRRALAVGALFAWASFYKHVMIVPVGVLALAHVALPPAARTRREAAVEVAIAAGVGAVAWLASFAWFAAAGHLDVYYQTIFSYSAEYTARYGGMLANLLYSMMPFLLVPEWLRFSLILMIPAAVAMIAGLRPPPQRLWLLWLAFAFGTHLAVALPGRFAPHYYQLWMPVLVLGATLACWQLKIAAWPRAANALASVIAIVLVAHEAPSFAKSADEWSVAKYGGNVFVTTRDLALRLDDLLTPDETFFEWGSEPGLYAISGRRPISGVLNTRFSLSYGGTLQQRLTERILSDLQRSPPDLIILEEVALDRTPKDHPVYRWIVANYETFERFETFHLAARRGSDLARRQGQP
jgi:hypothetical protein